MSNSATLVSKRAFFCGNILEEYIYEKSIMFGGAVFQPKNKPDRIAKARTKFSISRARKQIRRIVNSNPSMDKFLTLTFADNVTDLKTANYEFKKFKQRLERTVNRKVKYICVPEFQKRGAVHYHLMLDLPFVPWQKLLNKWGFGRIKIEVIRNKNITGSYIAKYVSSDDKKKACKFDDLRYYGKKIYFYSRGILTKPLEVLGHGIDIIKQFCYPKLSLLSAYKCYNDFRGNITINIYRLS